MKNSAANKEFLITTIIKVSGYSAIFFVVIIFYFLLSQGLPTLKLVSLDSLFSTPLVPDRGVLRHLAADHRVCWW